MQHSGLHHDARALSGRRHVIWSRIDQKTCLKAITAAGLVPEVSTVVAVNITTGL